MTGVKGKKGVLLLGGDGFMGRALRGRLIETGRQIHVVTRSTILDSGDGSCIHGGGIENVELLRRLIPLVDTIVHLASATTPGLSARTPSLEANLNIAPTLGLLEELQRHPGVRLVYISSGGTVYGDPGRDPVTESAELRPVSFYGAGKVAVEGFLRSFQRMNGNPVVVLRPSNVYGPGQPRYQGFGVIRTMLQHALDGTTMSIWGDGSVVRDFLYIDDMIAAIEGMIDTTIPAGTFNAGSGLGHSLNELIRIIESTCDTHLPVRYQPSRGIDVQRIVLDVTSIRDHCGWKARTTLEHGVAKTWEWLRSQ
jgi:UDP-glucose 4-epimerase